MTAESFSLCVCVTSTNHSATGVKEVHKTRCIFFDLKVFWGDFPNNFINGEQWAIFTQRSKSKSEIFVSFLINDLIWSSSVGGGFVWSIHEDVASLSSSSGSTSRLNGAHSSVDVGRFEESHIAPSELCFYPWITSSTAMRTSPDTVEAFKEITPAFSPLSPICSES